MNRILIALMLVLPQLLWASDPYPVNPKIDILHYSFELNLKENGKIINGVANIHFRISQPETELELDLIGLSGETGMIVESVNINDSRLKYSHDNDKLTIRCPEFSQADTTLTIEVRYHGEPKDGLIISDNKFGKKSFFGDNWPDRGRNWLPCVDHVSDKATVEFRVTAPKQYNVVANGYRKACYPVSDELQLTHYVSTVALPTKVMVIGVSDFAIETVGFAGNTPIETWVYPENRDEGFLDYQPALDIVNYFSSKIGEYAFEKLANVQSKTVYGGMENSGAIFYYENSVSGKNRLHSLLAHEIAHQWFGDAVTEKDWHHIWLSEGFATYLETVCMSEYLGLSKIDERMSGSRDRVTKYFYRNPNAVIDTTITNFRRLLSTNSYQKGAWVLHMLRNELGEDDFWNGIRLYYRRYMNSNALTIDFRHCMEESSQKNLKPFFDQWLYNPGHPIIKTELTQSRDNKITTIIVKQLQELPAFSFPLEIVLLGDDTDQKMKSIFMITEKTQSFELQSSFVVKEIIVDPETKLLFEAFK